MGKGCGKGRVWTVDYSALRASLIGATRLIPCRFAPRSPSSILPFLYRNTPFEKDEGRDMIGLVIRLKDRKNYAFLSLFPTL